MFDINEALNRDLGASTGSTIDASSTQKKPEQFDITASLDRDFPSHSTSTPADRERPPEPVAMASAATGMGSIMQPKGVSASVMREDPVAELPDLSTSMQRRLGIDDVEHAKKTAEALRKTSKDAQFLETVRRNRRDAASLKAEPAPKTDRELAAEANEQELKTLINQRSTAELMDLNEYVRKHVQAGKALPIEGVAAKLKQHPSELLPFSPAKAARLLEANAIIEKWAGGEEITDEQKAKVEEIALDNEVKKSFEGKVLEVTAAMPAFMIEMAATGPVAGPVRAGTTKLGKNLFTEAMRKAVAKKLVGKIGAAGARPIIGTAKVAGKLVGDIPEAVVRAQFMPHRAMENAAQRMQPGFAVTKDDTGALQLALDDSNEGEKSFARAYAAGALDTVIETASEASGGAFAQIGEAMKKKAIKYAIVRDWLASNGVTGNIGKAIRDATEKAGFHGIFNEWLEERYGGALRGVTGLEGDQRDNAIVRALKEGIAYRGDVGDMLSQHAVELVSFYVPGFGAKLSERVLSLRDPANPDAQWKAKVDGFVAKGLQHAKDKGVEDEDTLSSIEGLLREYVSSKEDRRKEIETELNRIVGADIMLRATKARKSISDEAVADMLAADKEAGITEQGDLDALETLYHQLVAAKPDDEAKRTTIKAKIRDIQIAAQERFAETKSPQPAPAEGDSGGRSPSGEAKAGAGGDSKTTESLDATINQMPLGRAAYARSYVAWINTGRRPEMRPPAISVSESERKQVEEDVDLAHPEGLSTGTGDQRAIDAAGNPNAARALIRSAIEDGNTPTEVRAELFRVEQAIDQGTTEAITPAIAQMAPVQAAAKALGFDAISVRAGDGTTIVRFGKGEANEEPVRSEDAAQRRVVGRGQQVAQDGQGPDADSGRRQGRSEPEAVPAPLPEVTAGQKSPATAENNTQQAGGAGTSDITAAANQAATSPTNDRPEPTEAQKKAGNYAKGHVPAKLHGFDVSIENPSGSQRRPEWPTLQDHYGHILRTTGTDGDQIDVFINPTASTDDVNARPVFVIDQNDQNGAFDEHKAMFGYQTEQEARDAYQRNYTKGWKGLGAIRQMTSDEFKTWAKSDAPKKSATNKDGSHPSFPSASQSLPGKSGKSVAQDDQKYVDALNRAIGPTSNITIDDTADMRQSFTTARAIASELGIRVIPIRNATFDGVFRDASPGVVFIRTDAPSMPIMFTVGHEIVHAIRHQHPHLWPTMVDQAKKVIRDVPKYKAKYEEWLNRNRPTGSARQEITQDHAEEELVADLMGEMWNDPAFWQQIAKADLPGGKTSPALARLREVLVEMFDKIIAAVKSIADHVSTKEFVSDMEQARAAAVEFLRVAAEAQSKETTNAKGQPTPGPAVPKSGANGQTVANPAPGTMERDASRDGRRQPSGQTSPETRDPGAPAEPAVGNPDILKAEATAYPPDAEKRAARGENPFPDQESPPPALPVSVDTLRDGQATTITGHKVKGLQNDRMRGIVAAIARHSDRLADMFFGAGTLTYFLHKSGLIKPGHIVSEFEPQRYTLARQLRAGNAEKVSSYAIETMHYLTRLVRGAKSAVAQQTKHEDIRSAIVTFLQAQPTPDGVSAESRSELDQKMTTRFEDSYRRSMTGIVVEKIEATLSLDADERQELNRIDNPSELRAFFLGHGGSEEQWKTVKAFSAADFAQAKEDAAIRTSLRWWVELTTPTHLVDPSPSGLLLLARMQQKWQDDKKKLRGAIREMRGDKTAQKALMGTIGPAIRRTEQRAPVPPAMKNTPEAAGWAVAFQWAIGSMWAATTDVKMNRAGSSAELDFPGQFANDWRTDKKGREKEVDEDRIRTRVGNLAAALKTADIIQADSWPSIVDEAKRSDGKTGFLADPSYFAQIENGKRRGTKNYNMATEIKLPVDLLYHVDRYLMEAWRYGSRIVLTNTWEDALAAEMRKRGWMVLQFERDNGEKEMIAYNFNPKTGQINPRRDRRPWIDQQMDVPEKLTKSPTRITPEQDAAYLAAVERGDIATAQRMVDDAAFSVLPQLVASDVEHYRPYSFSMHLSRLAEERERDTRPSERQYIESNRSDAAKYMKIADAAMGKRTRILNMIPKAYAYISKGVRFIAGIEDVLEGGGIDFEEVALPEQELVGHIVARRNGKKWLITPSGAIARGAQLLSGGLNKTTAADTEGIAEQYERREFSPTGSGDSVSSNDPVALVAIEVEDSDTIKSADPVTRDDAGRVIPLSERFNDQSDDIRYSPDRGTPTGEYWYQDGQLMGADGDIGDMNHESYAIQAAANKVADALSIEMYPEEVAFDLDAHEADINDQLELEDPTQEAQRAAIIKALVDAGETEEEAEDTLETALGGAADARIYGVARLGWIRVKGTDADVLRVTSDTMKSAADAFDSAYYEETGEEMDPESEVSVYEYATKAYYTNVPMEVLRSGDMNAMRRYSDRLTRGQYMRDGAQFSPARTPHIVASNAIVIGPAMFSPIRAFHGTRHDLLQFMIERVGTGEGAQAFGHGLYFAQLQLVAEFYRDKLSPPSKVVVDGREPNTDAERRVWQRMQGMFKAMAYLGHDLDARTVIDDVIGDIKNSIQANQRHRDARPDMSPNVFEETIQRLNQELKVAEGIDPAKTQYVESGKLYEVEIDGEDHEFIDWDARFDQQSEFVRAAMSDIVNRRRAYMQEREGIWSRPIEDAINSDDGAILYDHTWTTIRKLGQDPLGRPRTDNEIGASIAKYFKDTGRDSTTLFSSNRVDNPYKIAASFYLRSRGIKGIRYADEQSRTRRPGEKKTYNYVVFDDKDIKITAKNGRRIPTADAMMSPTRAAPDGWKTDKLSGQVVGYRGGKGTGPSTDMGTEGVGVYIAREKDLAEQFGAVRTMRFAAPQNAIVAWPLYILQESEDIMKPPAIGDGAWLSAHKEAVRRTGITDDTWGDLHVDLQQALSEVLMERGHDAVHVKAPDGGDEWMVLLENHESVRSGAVKYSPKRNTRQDWRTNPLAPKDFVESRKWASKFTKSWIHTSGFVDDAMMIDDVSEVAEIAEAAIKDGKPEMAHPLVLRYWMSTGFVEIAKNLEPTVTKTFEDALARVPENTTPDRPIWRFQGYPTPEARDAVLRRYKPGRVAEIKRPVNAFSSHQSYGLDLACTHDDVSDEVHMIAFLVEQPRMGRSLDTITRDYPTERNVEVLYPRHQLFTVDYIGAMQDGTPIVALRETVKQSPKATVAFSPARTKPVKDVTSLGFYSRLQRAIQSLPAGEKRPKTGQQWKGWINKMRQATPIPTLGSTWLGGINAEEIEWSGIMDYLEDGKRYTRSQVLAAARPITIKQVVKTSNERNSAAIAFDGWTEDEIREHLIETNLTGEGDNLSAMNRAQLIAFAEANADEFEGRDNSQPDDPKHARYQLPGGTNYREVLLTLPIDAQRGRGWQDYNREMKERGVTMEDRESVRRIFVGAPPEEGMLEGVERARTIMGDAFMDNYRSVLASKDANQPVTEAVFQSGHWDEANVLVHARVNDREVPRFSADQLNDIGERLRVAMNTKDADYLGSGAPVVGVARGVITQDEAAAYAMHRGFNSGIKGENATIKTLFIEEIQSDWHQKGREKGYGPPPPKDSTGWTARINADATARLTAEAVSQVWRVYDQHGQIVSATIRANNAAQAIAIAAQPPHTGIPDAPFKDTSKGWARLMFRRLLRMAVDGGYRQIAWTAGAVQIDRWTSALRQNVDRIETINLSIGKPARTVIARKRDNSDLYEVVEIGERGPSWKGSFTTMAEAEKFASEHRNAARNEVIVNAFKNGNKVLSQTFPLTGTYYISGQDVSLDDVIGSELAHKVRTSGQSSMTFSGDNLTIGGRGFQEFYDQIVPAIANQIGKKYDVKTETSAIVGKPIHVLPVTPAMAKDVKNGQPLLSPTRTGPLTEFDSTWKTTAGLTAYHVTFEHNADAIEREGIRNDMESNEARGVVGAVFMADADQARELMAQIKDGGDTPAVFEIYVPRGTTLYQDAEMPAGTSFYTRDTIPPRRLRRVSEPRGNADIRQKMRIVSGNAMSPSRDFSYREQFGADTLAAIMSTNPIRVPATKDERRVMNHPALDYVMRVDEAIRDRIKGADRKTKRMLREIQFQWFPRSTDPKSYYGIKRGHGMDPDEWADQVSRETSMFGRAGEQTADGMAKEFPWDQWESDAIAEIDALMAGEPESFDGDEHTAQQRYIDRQEASRYMDEAAAELSPTIERLDPKGMIPSDVWEHSGIGQSARRPYTLSNGLRAYSDANGWHVQIEGRDWLALEKGRHGHTRLRHALEARQNAMLDTTPSGDPADEWDAAPVDDVQTSERDDQMPFSPTRITPEQDSAYLAAVERGDMETAQQMVDDAAKADGYNVGPAFHGTPKENAGFTVFDKSKSRRITDAYGFFDGQRDAPGIYFSNQDTKHEAKGYAGEDGVLISARLRASKWAIAVMDAQGPNFFDKKTWRRIGRSLPKEYDGVEAYWRGDDGEAEETTALEAKHNAVPKNFHAWVVFNSNQIKSADPVTRDDAGRVIPLSERFNTMSDDLRYSPTRATKTDDELLALARMAYLAPPAGQEEHKFSERLRTDPRLSEDFRAAVEPMFHDVQTLNQAQADATKVWEEASSTEEVAQRAISDNDLPKHTRLVLAVMAIQSLDHVYSAATTSEDRRANAHRISDQLKEMVTGWNLENARLTGLMRLWSRSLSTVSGAIAKFNATTREWRKPIEDASKSIVPDISDIVSADAAAAEENARLIRENSEIRAVLETAKDELRSALARAEKAEGDRYTRQKRFVRMLTQNREFMAMDEVQTAVASVATSNGSAESFFGKEPSDAQPMKASPERTRNASGLPDAVFEDLVAFAVGVIAKGIQTDGELMRAIESRYGKKATEYTTFVYEEANERLATTLQPIAERSTSKTARTHAKSKKLQDASEAKKLGADGLALWDFAKTAPKGFADVRVGGHSATIKISEVEDSAELESQVFNLEDVVSEREQKPIFELPTFDRTPEEQARLDNEWKEQLRRKKQPDAAQTPAAKPADDATAQTFNLEDVVSDATAAKDDAETLARATGDAEDYKAWLAAQGDDGEQILTLAEERAEQRALIKLQRQIEAIEAELEGRPAPARKPKTAKAPDTAAVAAQKARLQTLREERNSRRKALKTVKTRTRTATTIADATNRSVTHDASGAPFPLQDLLETKVAHIFQATALAMAKNKRLLDAAASDKTVGDLLADAGINPADVQTSERLLALPLSDLVAPPIDSPQAIKKEINRRLKNMGTTIDQIVIDHGSKTEGVRDAIMADLQAKLGLTATAASRIAKLIEASLKSRTDVARKARIDRLVEKIKKIKALEPHAMAIRELLELRKLGAFATPAEITDAIAQAAGLPVMTPEIASDLAALSSQIERMPDGVLRDEATQRLLAYIADRTPPRMWEAVKSVAYANMLSGFRTQQRNVLFNTINLIATTAANAIRHPTLLPGMIAGMAKAFGPAWTHFASNIQGRGTWGREHEFKIPGELERDPFEKKYGKIGRILDQWKYVRRFMQAADALAYKPAEYQHLFIQAFETAQKDGLPFHQAYARAWDKMRRDPQHRRTAAVEARIYGLGRLDEARRAEELWMRSFTENDRAVAMQDALRTTFNLPRPEGRIGYVSEALGKTPDDAARMLLFPFTRIVGNAMNEMIAFSPVGFAQAAFRQGLGTIQYDPATQSHKRIKPTTTEDVQRFQHEQAILTAKATIGTAITMAILYAAAQAAGGLVAPPPDDKDRKAKWDDPELWITGYGPRNKAERELLISQGWKPFSLRFKGRWYHYGQWSMALPISLVGTWFDVQRWSKRKDDDLGSIAYMSAAMFQVMLNASFLQNTADFLGAIAPGSMTSQEFERAAMRIGLAPTGWVVPGLYRQTMSAMRDVRRDPRDIIETIRYQTGIMADGIRPAINQLGDPVRANNNVLFTDHDAADKVTDFLRKTGHAPGYIGDRTLKMDDGTKIRTADAPDVKYAMTWAAGRMFKDEVARQIGELSSMDAAEQERAIDDIRTDTRKAAVAATERAVSEHGAEAFVDWQKAQQWINEAAEK